MLDAVLNIAGLTRSLALRQEIMSPRLSFLMEAHNGISAKIVEEAGFHAIWASGLTISASLGLRDSNEASWTQVLEVLEYMADSTALPILVDGDTGYGNFNNVRRLVRKLCDRQIAGVCIEDKLFPKTNSFIGEWQPLAEIGEFCGRIKAGKDSQSSDDFVLVARIEALIAGRGVEEALRRAEAYYRAGADAVLIHSKQPHPAEILSFAESWHSQCPILIVPTMYYTTPTEVFRKAGISAVIWANHNLRAAITAMRETSRRIFQDQALIETEGRVASVREIFRLVGNAELETAERHYLPSTATAHGIILAATRGDMGELTRDLPKCMIDIRGRPLLERLTGTLSSCGIRDITVIRGYRKEAVNVRGIRTVDNDRYAETGELCSLLCARQAMVGDTVIVYGDVLFRSYILEGLMAATGEIVVAVDARKTPSRSNDKARDLVDADRPYSGDYLDDTPVLLRRVSPEVDPRSSVGEWIGLLRCTAVGLVWAGEEIERIRAEGLLETADLPFLLSRLAARHPVSVHYVTAHWLDVDTLGDLAAARNFT
jgi:phosphoenolpyruvate phosphomutase